ncbi:MAG: hypothetical protein AB8H86_18480 [Polyangiales bacterium]
MNNKILLALFFGAVVGCVANEAVRAGTVTAQATPGTSAPGQFRECVAYVIGHDSDPEDLAANAEPLPSGWTAVGGGGIGNRSVPSVILCR